MFSPGLSALAAIALAACTMTTIEGDGRRPAPDSNDTCGAGAFAQYLGQPRSELDGVAIPQPYRIYGVGDPITMDYSAGRLNFQIGADGTIARITCG